MEARPGPRPRARPRGRAEPGAVARQIDEIGHAYEALEEIVVHGQETGEFRGDIDSKVAATVFYGALEEVLTGWVMGQLPDTDEDIARAEHDVTGMLVAGFTNRAEGYGGRQNRPPVGEVGAYARAAVFVFAVLRAYCLMKRSTAACASSSGICFGGDFIR